MVSTSQLLTCTASVIALIAGIAAFWLACRRASRAGTLMAVACVLWGGGEVWAAVTGSGPRLSWTLAATIIAVAATLTLSGPFHGWRDNLPEIRRICEASMLAGSGSVLTFLVFDTTGRVGVHDPWLPLLAIQLLLLALLVTYAVRDSSSGLLLAAAGSALLVASGSAITLSSGITALALYSGFGLAGWGLLMRGMLVPVAGRTGPGSGSCATAAGPDSPAPGQRNVVSTTLLGAIAAGIILVALSPRNSLLYVVLILVAVLAFGLHELVRDVQQQDLIAQLASLAGTDPLTGLGNRRALSATMARIYSQQPPEAASVLTIDLDNFKLINTLLGHQAGDELLVGVAAALSAQCTGEFGQSAARAFRLGGDEFAVLVQASPAETTALAERLIASISGVAGSTPGIGRVDVSASIGIAHRSLTGQPALADGLSDLTRSGDAMRAAKAAGRAQVLTYGEVMAKDQSRHDSMERRLRRAIANGEVQLHYQPIISLPEMRMVGMESLARWTDEELGPVSPEEFIPIAEDCGLIVELGLQLARRSMEMALETGAHAAGLNAGVNVSPIQLRSPAFVAQMAELIREIGVDPGRFAIEVTESVRIEDDDPAVAAIWKLAELGMPIAIDDFGTGYASLSLISSLPIKILKLDRSITQKLDDPRGLAIARCVSDMARALEIDVVAEGIETAEHLDAIRKLDVGFGQGWLFERAVTAERFAEFVRDPGLVLRHLPASMMAPARVP